MEDYLTRFEEARGFLSACITSHLLGLLRLFRKGSGNEESTDRTDKWDVLGLTQQREEQLEKSWRSKVTQSLSVCSSDLWVIGNSFTEKDISGKKKNRKRKRMKRSVTSNEK